jgi:hypothetical protein
VRIALVAAVFGLALLSGCGARPAPTSILDDRFETPEAEDAQERAPDLYAAASRARIAAAHAEDAGRRPVAEDHGTRARLLLDAAIAEAERLRLEEERLSVEARLRETEVAHGRAVTRREEILLAIQRLEASRVAAAEAALAFQTAAGNEEQRYRGQSVERAALHQEAAAVLSRRALLLMAAAQAQGAAPNALRPVTALLERADAASAPARKLELTEEAVRAALTALGVARQAAPSPTSDARAALIEAADEAGFDVEQRDRGLTVRVPDVFRGSGAGPTGAGAERLERLAAIIAAHPHGAIHVVAHATTGAGEARQRAASARAARAKAILIREGVPAARLADSGVFDAVAEDARESIEATFVAYGLEVR